MPATCETDGNGTQRWRNSHGDLHSDDDLPSVVYQSGLRIWHRLGKRHRDNDLPAYEGECMMWYQYGSFHREGNLPAYICGSSMEWYVHGKYIGNQDVPPKGAVFPGTLTKSAQKL